MNFKGKYHEIEGVLHIWNTTTKSYDVYEPKSKEAVNIDALTAKLKAELKAELSGDKNFAKDVLSTVQATELKSTDIPEDDLMDTKVYMYAYNASLVIFNRNDRGREIAVPYGRPIVFKQFMVEKGTNERGKPTEMPLCRVEIWSKKQLEFLKGHPWHNRIFFDTLDGISHIDKSTITFRMQAVLKVSAMNQREVALAAENMNMDTTVTPNELRDNLVDKYIELTKNQMDKQRESIATNNLNTELLLQGKARAAVGMK